MKKIKVLSKEFISNGKKIKLKISLAKNTGSFSSEYAVIAETENNISVFPAGKDISLANLIFKFFYNRDVFPETVDDIVHDMMFEKFSQAH